MSILSTILGWFTPTPKQETPAQKAERISALGQAAALRAATKIATAQHAQVVSELEARMSARRIRLAEQSAAAAGMKVARHEARLAQCDKLAAEIDAFEHDDHAAMARATKAAPILAIYLEELSALTAEEVVAGASDALDVATMAARRSAGIL